MKSFGRWLLVFAMVLALPLQGLAAMGLRHCAPQAAVMHEHGAHDPAEHGGHAAHAAADAADPSAAPGLPGDHTCSACAACCALSALPAAGLGVSPAPAAASPPRPGGGIAASFLTDRLERPPRPHLA